MNSRNIEVALTIESPGKAAPDGGGWAIRAGFAKTRFGLALLAECPLGLCHLSFLDPGEKITAWNGLVSAWPGSRVTRDNQRATELAAGIFLEDGAVREAFPLRAFVSGTDFQIKVWRALLGIPFGSLVTYSEIAAAIGHPMATRATGTAAGKNPLAWAIPCHRVIGKSGELGNYRWGGERKRAIIEWESEKIARLQGNARISMSR